MVNVADLPGIGALEDELARIETVLRRSVSVKDPLLSQVAEHLIAAGGKRIRPLLTIAAASACGGKVSEEVLQAGVAVELVHLASLYHDDVMDEASTRRAVASVNARWGNLVAVVTGDFLLARAAEIAASLGSEPARMLAQTLGRMCEGQVAELNATFDASRSEDSYALAVSGKTASLLACSCGLGALTAGASQQDTEALSRFGEAFGMVFQIRDDILDVVGSEEILGKEPGQDLAKGIYTLPVLVALEDRGLGAELAAMLGAELSDQERETARALVAASNGPAAALAAARSWADQAVEATNSLPPSMAKEALRRLPHALLDNMSVPVASNARP